MKEALRKAVVQIEAIISELDLETNSCGECQHMTYRNFEHKKAHDFLRAAVTKINAAAKLIE